MEDCLGDLHVNWCIIYLDDITLFSKHQGDHIWEIREVFEKLDQTGLKLKPSKCDLTMTRFSYLGHNVSKDDTEIDHRKTEAIRNWPTPTTVTDFLGFINHYRRFIHWYAHIARSFNLLTSRENANKKKQSVLWNDDCAESFQKITALCSSTPILACADYSKPFKLHTDVCGLKMGAVFISKTGRWYGLSLCICWSNIEYIRKDIPST